MKNIITIALLLQCLLFQAQSVDPGIVIREGGDVSTLEERAINFYTAQIDRDPTNVQALLMRSELYRALGETNKGEDDLRFAMTINPYAQLYISRDYRSQIFPRKNFSYMTEEDQLEEEDADVAVNDFAKSFFLTMQYSEMLDLDSLEEDAVLQLNSVLTALIHKDYDDAEILLQAVPITPENDVLHHDLMGILLLKKGQAEESVPYFSRSIKQDPNFMSAYHNRAVAYKKLGRYEESEADFSQAIRINSDVSQVYFGKGKLMELKGDIPRAMAYYQQAMDKEGGYPQAGTNYSAMLKATGDYTNALIKVNSLIEQSPSSPENYYLRGGLHFVHGQYTNAIADLETYLEAMQNDNEALFFLGLSKLLNDQNRKGCKDMSDSIDEGYDGPNVDMILYMCD